MKQEEAAQVFRNYFSYINRSGAKDLLAWIESNGFHEAPASKGHHGARPGGLAEHSINVFRRLLWLNAEEEKRQQSPQYDLETLAVCGLLHDLCKIDAYEDVGEAQHIMNLKQEEILAIRWQMVQYDFYARGGGYDLDNAFRQCKLAVMLHLADMMATYFDEREDPEK